MPRISIELSDDKLLTLIPILLKEGIKFMVSPDKSVHVMGSLKVQGITYEKLQAQGELFQPNIQVITSGQSVPREVKHVHHIKGRKLPDIVLEYFDSPERIISSKECGIRIEKLGFQSASASTALNTLFKEGKVVRIKSNRMFYYSLNKEYDPLAFAKAS